jgi:hypothetical protein
MPATTKPIAQTHRKPFLKAPPRISSLEKKPASGGTPAMAIEPMSIVAYVIGILRARPPILRMSCSPSTAWITEPESRKSRPLKKPWLIRWKIAAVHAPTPSEANM